MQQAKKGEHFIIKSSLSSESGNGSSSKGLLMRTRLTAGAVSHSLAPVLMVETGWSSVKPHTQTEHSKTGTGKVCFSK